MFHSNEMLSWWLPGCNLCTTNKNNLPMISYSDCHIAYNGTHAHGRQVMLMLYAKKTASCNCISTVYLKQKNVLYRQEKTPLLLWAGMKIICLSRSPLVIIRQTGDTPDGLIYPTLTLMKHSYALAHQISLRIFAVFACCP